MPRGQRLAFLAVAAVIAVVAVIVLRPSSEDTNEAGQSRTTEPTPPTGQSDRGGRRDERLATPPEAEYQTIRLEDGRTVGGAMDITVESGEIVR